MNGYQYRYGGIGFRLFLSTVGLTLFLFGCTGGQYGFTRTYSPRRTEKPFYRTAVTPPFTVVVETIEDYQKKRIGWFGVVEDMTLTDDGRYMLTLSHHVHRGRHLCRTEAVSSCRVTINEKSSGTFQVLLQLEPEDTAAGLDRLKTRSLMKVYGTIRVIETEPGKKQVLMEGDFYRHWPRRYYVTTLASSTMIR